MKALFVLVVELGVPGAFPAWVVLRRSPAVVFVAPLLGAALASVGTELELGLGGTLAVWETVVSVIVNLMAVGWWVHTGHRRGATAPEVTWTWCCLTLVALVGALAIPLTGLITPMIGYDANAIWITHALMIAGGHGVLLTDLQNGAYSFAHSDYPPLASAPGALGFVTFGMGDLRLAVEVTVLLNACALGVVGAGLARTGNGERAVTRTLAVLAGAAICIVGFAVAGENGVNGLADLLWSAAALAAVIWGLVLPKSSSALGCAWICLVVASLTKNEGLTTALIVAVLIALRYRAVPLRRLWSPAGPTDRARVLAAIGRWSAVAAIPLLPGAAWFAIIHIDGIHSSFFGASSGQSVALRARATIDALAVHLEVLPVALCVFTVGCVILRGRRRDTGLGHAGWLWAAAASYLAVLFWTYLVGSPEIHWWLLTTLGRAGKSSRTTIFPQVAFYADLAIWLVLAVEPSRSAVSSAPSVEHAAPSAPQVSASAPLAPGRLA